MLLNKHDNLRQEKGKVRKESIYLDSSVPSAYFDTRVPQQLLSLVLDFPQLELSGEIEQIATGYVNHKIIPQSAFADAIHIAIASFYKIDFLVTWNCEHLAEAHRRRKVRLFNTMAGIYVPELVTPMELKITKEGDENGIPT